MKMKLEHFNKGGITGAMEISITYPTEYTKTVMQLYPEENKKGMVRVGMDTIRQRGFFGNFYTIFNPILIPSCSYGLNRIVQRIF